MSHATSPSINDLVKQHAFRSYQEAQEFEDDAISAGISGHPVSEALALGFGRGYSSRDEHFQNLDNAYGELLSNSTSLRDGLSVYADFVVRLQNRMAKSDVPDGLAADISQMIYDTAHALNEI